MKYITIKSVKIWSNGSVSFENTFLKSGEQFIVYEKDRANSVFARKAKASNLFLNSPSASYKSKYKL